MVGLGCLGKRGGFVVCVTCFSIVLRTAISFKIFSSNLTVFALDSHKIHLI